MAWLNIKWGNIPFLNLLFTKTKIKLSALLFRTTLWMELFTLQLALWLNLASSSVVSELEAGEIYVQDLHIPWTNITTITQRLEVLKEDLSARVTSPETGQPISHNISYTKDVEKINLFLHFSDCINLHAIRYSNLLKRWINFFFFNLNNSQITVAFSPRDLTNYFSILYLFLKRKIFNVSFWPIILNSLWYACIK